MFDSLRPRQPVPVGKLKALAELAERSRPATAQGNAAAPMYGAGGAAFQVPDNNWFLARIEDVSGSGTSAKYSFTEINTVAGTGGDEDRVSGRANDIDNDPARDPSGATHEEDDVVLVRRNVANPGEWEVFAPAGSGSQPPSDCNAEGLQWLADVDSVTADRDGLKAAVRLTVTQAKGRCDCVEEGQEFLLVAEDDTTFAGWGQLEGCDLCSTVTLALNAAATLLLQIPTFTITFSDGTTLLARAVCGSDGKLYLSGFNTKLCDDELADPPICENYVEFAVRCDVCDLPAVGCASCAEGVGPAVWKVVAGSLTWYAAAGGACGCSWTMTCGGYTVTVAVGETTITVTYVTPDGSATYVYDTNTATPGEDNPPSCLSAHTIARTTGSNPLPASVTITPLACDTEGTAADPCELVPDGESVWVRIVGSYCSDGLYELPQNSPAPARSWGGGAGSVPPILGTSSSPHALCDSIVDLVVECVDDLVYLSVPTVYTTFPEVCDAASAQRIGCVTGGAAVVFDVCKGYFGWHDATGRATVIVCASEDACTDPALYWCVDDGTGVLSCTSSLAEPAGAVAGPYCSAEQCAQACACSDGSFTPMMAAAPEGEELLAPEGEMMVMGATATRRVPLSMRKGPCAHLGAATGEVVACDSCGGKKAAAVYGCGVHGECTADRKARRKVPGEPGTDLPWCRTCPSYSPTA